MRSTTRDRALAVWSGPLVRFRRQDDGATMTEYALLLAVLALVALAGAKVLGTTAGGHLGAAADAVGGQAGTEPGASTGGSSGNNGNGGNNGNNGNNGNQYGRGGNG
jgi:Flp pilus assembly pilin Flp